MSESAQDTPAEERHVESFVVRFTLNPDGEAGGAPAWHGLIRHVQSNTEHRFIRFEEAIAFIECRVPMRFGGGSAERDA